MPADTDYRNKNSHSEVSCTRQTLAAEQPRLSQRQGPDYQSFRLYLLAYRA
jgi:hypothetical protein